MMPLMKGGDLASAMPKLGAVARVRVMRDVLRGLQALHTCNILHFDVSYTPPTGNLGSFMVVFR